MGRAPAEVNTAAPVKVTLRERGEKEEKDEFGPATSAPASLYR
jgi:hypothetical protein